MNSLHDMGGMHNFGPVVPEAGAPTFHAPWERRAFALTLAMGGTRMWNIDQSRAAREALPPAQYLASSYYQIWLGGLIELMLERGLISAEELAEGRMLQPPVPVPNVVIADKVAAALARGSPTAQPLGGVARFRVGDPVRAKLCNPATHTRLPRYCRGRRGSVAMTHGAHVFADANALGKTEARWLYTVRFEGSELWGPDTSAAAVHVDCWEPYLEAV
jgi:nitrile hydratase subunit beta